ncbi:hypothetical protein G7Y79_00056g090230 [Physcia stellaris]|nr:hypothetical protein G7Y79_00056g090230 [Physcia stellaris]
MAKSLEQTGQLGASCTSADGTTQSDHDRGISRASGFFALPLEIRLQIYKHAFHKGALNLRQRLVFRDHPHYDMHYAVDFIRDPQEVVLDTGFGSKCDKERGTDYPERPPLESLQTCQEFYAEGSKVLWATNTWHFDGVKIFGNVLARTNPQNRAAMKSLSIEVPWRDLCEGACGAWARLLQGPHIETLCGLRELKVVITRFNSPGYVLVSGYRRQVRFFGTFSKIPLETVEVSIQTLSYRPDVSDQAGSWSQVSLTQGPCAEPVIFNYSQLIKREILGEAPGETERKLAIQRRIERQRLDGQSRRMERRKRREELSQSLEAELNLWTD